MNQLPITLTLYYPTAAQFEAYLGFMAMLSIFFSITVVYSAIKNAGWLETERAIDNLHFIASILNPVGFAGLVLAGYRKIEYSVFSALIFLITPLFLLIPFML